MFPLSKLFLFNDISKPRSGELNMAIDEVLLERCSASWLRFYSWAKPTISIGYFMAHESVEFNTSPWVRRWTGGGIVTHGILNETTFTLGFPRGTKAAHLSSSFCYHQIHRIIGCLLTESGIKCHLDEGSGLDATNKSCFDNPVTSDVISSSSGAKIVGGAQRRSRHGLLHQGSIHKTRLPSQFDIQLARRLSARVESRLVDSQIEDAAIDLSRLKYSTAQWKLRK